MNEINLEKDKEELLLDIFFLPTYEDFDKIIKYLEYKYNVIISKKLDGPDMRVWNLTINDIPFKLYNDPYGNTLIYNYKNNFFIKKIASSLQDDLII